MRVTLNLTRSVCAYDCSCFLLRLGLFTALKSKNTKKQNQKISSEELFGYWHLPLLRTDRAREHQNTAATCCVWAEQGRAEHRKGGRQVCTTEYLQCASEPRRWEHEWLNEKPNKKRRPTIYCMPMKPRLIQTARIIPPHPHSLCISLPSAHLYALCADAPIDCVVDARPPF